MSSERVEHLSSVHDNPFVRQFGIPLYTRHGDEAESSLPSSTNSERGDDDEGVQEYHVNSGFVNKLRSKFAQLENKSNRVTLSKKSASVENLLSCSSNEDYSLKTRTRKGSAGRFINDDSSITSSNKANLRHFTPAGYQPKIRPRSNELEKSSDKSFIPKREAEKLKQNNVIRSVRPPLPAKKTSYDTTTQKRFRTSASEIVPKPVHHDWKVAPDLEKVGRADIVIIDSKHENDKRNDYREKSVEVEDKVEVRSPRESSPEDTHEKFGRVKPAVEKDRVSDENELPKPNTVSNFRTLFEKTNKTLDTLHFLRSAHSPTRKSSGSDTNSPQILSPVSTPRSPLTRVTNDNVFDNSTLSQESEVVKTSSPIDFVDIVKSPIAKTYNDTNENVDTTTSSMQKSLEMFKLAAVEREHRSSSVERNEGERNRLFSSDIPSAQHTLTPVHPVSKVFDSKLVKKSDKPKPTVRAHRNIEEPHPVPKDVLEMKHDSDRRKRLSESEDTGEVKIEDRRDSTSSSPVINQNDIGVSYEDNVKPSKKKDVSHRQTKVFDSSRMVKKDRERPKVPISPVQSPVPVPENVPKTVIVEETKPEPSIVRPAQDITDSFVPVKPPRRSSQSNDSGVTEEKTNIVRNETKDENKARSFKVSEQMFPKPDLTETKPEPVKVAKPADNKGAVSGMSSFLANRLKKTQPDQVNLHKSSASHLVNGTSASPVPKKRQAPSRPDINGTAETSEEKPPALPKSPEPPLQPLKSKKNQQNATKGKMVFDSSKIATKRKEPPKRKPPRKTLEELNQNITFDNPVEVPKLDLSSITNEKPAMEYQEGYLPTVIRPCPFHFVGAEITFHKSPYKKNRKAKVKISFDDHATTTFEYEGEESALQNYLIDHPEEKDEVLKQEEERNGMEGSADEILNDTPRSPTEDVSTMKSNTLIGVNTGSLTSYKSKMQTQDFQFGMTRNEEPEVTYTSELDEETAPVDFLPADDTELDAFSAEVDKSDMLF